MLNLPPDIVDRIDSIEKLTFYYQRDLTKYSTMKARACGSIALVESEEALSCLLKLLTRESISYRVIGWGANFVLPENTDFILIRLDFPFDKKLVTADKNSFVLPASTPLNQLTSLAIKNGFKGWEVFTGVPASLGGAIVMNAGTNLGEIGSLIKRVWIMTKEGRVRECTIDKESFVYRHNHFMKPGEILVRAEVTYQSIDDSVAEKIQNYLKLRQETQPLKEKTCGCMFKNYKSGDTTCPAGLYLDIMGLKGFNLYHYRISPVHANFLENTGEGSHSGLVKALKFVSGELENQYGISFEEEIRY